MWIATDYPTGYKPPKGVKQISLDAGIKLLNKADEAWFHNGIGYDHQVLRKLRSDYSLPVDNLRDTLVYARLLWPRDYLMTRDYPKAKRGDLPKNMIGAHSLEAFGYRMGILKGDYTTWCKERGIEPWSECRPEMLDYCVQDVVVTEDLRKRIEDKKYPEGAARVEHQVAAVCAQIHLNGFPFDEEAAQKLYVEVVDEKEKLNLKLQTMFKPWYASGGTVESKKSLSYKDPLRPNTVAGAKWTRIKRMDFNPNSRDHIADRLRKICGWEPEDFTDKGKPKVDETTLSKVNHPIAKELARYLTLQKRAAQLREGKEGWLTVSEGGIIHASINSLGAVTRRATHHSPNLSQVPRVGSYLGEDCRALFGPGDGYVQVGTDQAGIELRMLAHYMARWDGGTYAEAVINGKQSDGTDVHSMNTRALGLDPKKLYTVNGRQATGRDIAKTFIYAFLYGAGAAKLARILGLSESKGAKVKRDFLKRLPALKSLIDAVQAKAATGKLLSLDGGPIPVRSQHSALNTLLQSAGAVAAKYWIVEVFAAIEERGWTHPVMYPKGDEDLLLRHWSHDELQFSARSEIADELGKLSVGAIESAGVRLNLRVPITGEYKVGNNWRDCH